MTSEVALAAALAAAAPYGLHACNQTANTASNLLLQHYIHQQQFERWIYVQFGFQLVDHMAAAAA
jgi:hypothetical protein